MVVIGVDSHKRTHTVVAVDEAGRKLAERTAPATADGHLELLGWSRTWPERTWALEDCRNLTRRLEADLLRGGEAVRRVPQSLWPGHGGRRGSPARVTRLMPSRSLGRHCGSRTCLWLVSMASSASSVSSWIIGTF